MPFWNIRCWCSSVIAGCRHIQPRNLIRTRVYHVLFIMTSPPCRYSPYFLYTLTNTGVLLPTQVEFQTAYSYFSYEAFCLVWQGCYFSSNELAKVNEYKVIIINIQVRVITSNCNFFLAFVTCILEEHFNSENALQSI